MTKRYSVTEARRSLSGLLRRVERTGPVEITRRGEVVAILVAARERHDAMPRRSIWDVIEAFRGRPDFAEIALTDEEVAELNALRDPSPGRSFSWRPSPPFPT